MVNYTNKWYCVLNNVHSFIIQTVVIYNSTCTKDNKYFIHSFIHYHYGQSPGVRNKLIWISQALIRTVNQQSKPMIQNFSWNHYFCCHSIRVHTPARKHLRYWVLESIISQKIHVKSLTKNLRHTVYFLA